MNVGLRHTGKVDCNSSKLRKSCGTKRGKKILCFLPVAHSAECLIACDCMNGA